MNEYASKVCLSGDGCMMTSKPINGNVRKLLPVGAGIDLEESAFINN